MLNKSCLMSDQVALWPTDTKDERRVIMSKNITFYAKIQCKMFNPKSVADECRQGMKLPVLLLNKF